MNLNDLVSKLRDIFRAKGLDPDLSGFKDNWKVAGPDEDEHPAVGAIDYMKTSGAPTFNSGWWQGARITAAYQGRIGGTIVPRSVVVHTTDTMPGGFNAIVKSWTTTLGVGCCAHFMIGRDEKDGVVQFVPIVRNGNHAGGPIHGNFKLNTGALVHPNLWTVGIELDAGGLCRRVGNTVVHPDTKRVLASNEVYWGSSGKPWHVVTDYQLNVLDTLLRDLKAALKPMDSGVTIAPDGSYAENGVPWAAPWRNDIVGHVTLDPVNKTDPGEQVIQWLKNRKD